MSRLINFLKKCQNVNKILTNSRLNFQTFGNVSQRIDKDTFTIKPSGVNVLKTSWKDYPILNIDNLKVVKGKLKPSTDSATHAEIYKFSQSIKGIVHAHSKYSVSWSQAQKNIPILGTTHSDYWDGDIMVTKALKKDEILKNYEKNIGKSIIKLFNKNNINLKRGVLVANHGGFCWGENAFEAYQNFERLEFIAELAFKTLILNKKAKISKELINKHYKRKNGLKSYYGQKK